MALRPYNDADYRRAKHHLATHVVDCWYGCGRRATTPDHRPRISEHRHVRGSGCCKLMPACHTCNSRDGAVHGNANRRPTSGWV